MQKDREELQPGAVQVEEVLEEGAKDGVLRANGWEPKEQDSLISEAQLMILVRCSVGLEAEAEMLSSICLAPEEWAVVEAWQVWYSTSSMVLSRMNKIMAMLGEAEAEVQVVKQVQGW